MNALPPAARPSQAPVPAPVLARTPYGAAELRGLHDAHLRRAFTVAALLAIGLIGGGRWLADALAGPVAAKPPPILVDRWVEPSVAPPSDAPAEPAGAASNDAVRAIPEPVPDAAVPETPDASSTLADNASPVPGPPGEDTGAGAGGTLDGSGTGPAIDPPLDLLIEPYRPLEPLQVVAPAVTPEPDVFEYVEVMPTVVTRPAPEYPEIARQAGIEGRVAVRVRIGRDGRVREASVVQSQNAIFDDAALDAVRRWTFTPGVQAGRAVEVWMTIPIRFRQSPR